METIKLQYKVLFSGHGSPFKEDAPQYCSCYWEAWNVARNWELISDTIGGRSQIIALDGRIIYNDID